MIKFQVGEPCPIMVPPEGGMIYFDKASFMFAMGMPNITPQEAKAAKKGEFTYSVFIEESIPFLIVKFKNAFAMDASFNFLKTENKEFIEADEANLVTLILADSATKILKGFRVCGFHPATMKLIKDACREQVNVYKSHKEVDVALDRIMREYTTDEMYAKGRKWRMKVSKRR